MSQETVLTAYFEEVVDVANIAFKGAVTAQTQAGEVVTLTVKKSDNTVTDVFTATTIADKTYVSSPRPYVAGDYSVFAHVDADAEYRAADSAPFAFTVALLDRTITVSVV